MTRRPTESAHSPCTTLFILLCGADANPNPRGKLEIAEHHGNELATEVMHVPAGQMSKVRGKTHAALQIVELGFNAYPRETLEQELKSKNIWRSEERRVGKECRSRWS